MTVFWSAFKFIFLFLAAAVCALGVLFGLIGFGLWVGSLSAGPVGSAVGAIIGGVVGLSVVFAAIVAAEESGRD